jgi:hypothetical protein
LSGATTFRVDGDQRDSGDGLPRMAAAEDQIEFVAEIAV